jgi:predicted SnoaL-like aldol condensation-catalyzing enzyme
LTEPNPYDPWQRTDLTANERTLLTFMRDCMHGDDLSLIDTLVAEDYIQHTPGIAQGREGLRRYIMEVARKRPNRTQWRAVQIFASGDMVILHKLISSHAIADFVRFNAAGQMAEHWDVVAPLPEPDYDPMRTSKEDLSRFSAVFDFDSGRD